MIETVKQIETPFVGTQEIKTRYDNEDNIPLTKRQKPIVKELIDNHLKDSNYIVTYYSLSINKYFTALHIWYFPKNAHNTIYTMCRKTIYIGTKGSIRKFTCLVGMSDKGRNVKKIWRYYVRASD